MINNIIVWLNNNAGMIQSTSSLLILFVTIVYVYVNSRMHSEMVRERKKRERPVVSIRIENQSTGIFNIIIENISDMPIVNLKFKKYPDVNLLSKGLISNIGFFENGISYMAPKQVYSSFFMAYIENTAIWDMLISFEIEFFNYNNKQYNDLINFNLSAFKKNYSLGNSFEDNVIKQLDSLNKTLSKKFDENLK